MTKEEGKSSSRTRNYAFIMYPDSRPENWREILVEHHVDVVISPLHDKDTNPDGTPKKPHWHVVLVFSSVKTQVQAQKIADSVNGTKVETVSSLRAYARYLIHKDNPEKAQYSAENVVTLGSIDYFELIASAADLDSAITEMEEWCDTNLVYSYAELCRYARKNRPDWIRLLRHRCTYHMKSYLQSCLWEIEHFQG